MLATLLLLAADPTAAEIVAQLAENQKKAVELRRGVVYKQEILARMHRSGNKLARENHYVFSVLPKPESFEREMLSFAGKYERKGKYITYDKPDFTYKNVDLDGEILHELVEEWTGENATKDGLSDDLFPLTAAQQGAYNFTLAGTEEYNGRRVYKLTFKRKKGEDMGEWWSGEALVDCEELQPVVVSSYQSKGIPMAVKIILGTDVRKTGFKVTYRNFGDGLWFPEKYGGELEFRVLFGYRRKVSISMLNSDLRRANVESSIRYDEPPPKP